MSPNSLSRRTAFLLLSLACLALTLAGAAGAADAGGAVAPDATAASADLAPSTIPDPGDEQITDPDELDDREAVRTRTHLQPYSSVGMLTTYSNYQAPAREEPDRGFKQGVGTLVSSSHVLTAAHVVTEDNGSVRNDQFWFAPGATADERGRTSAPFGRAKVVDVHVWKGYGGASSTFWGHDPKSPDAEDDLAVLELDRPIGDEASTMTVGSAERGRITGDGFAYSDDFTVLGYPATDEMVDGAADGFGLSYGAHTMNFQGGGGDSGAPVFLWDENTVRSVFVGGHDWFSHRSYAAPITPERHDWIQDVIDADGDALGRSELHRADRTEWVHPVASRAGPTGNHQPDELSADDPDGRFSTRLYNAGTEATLDSSVEFYLFEEWDTSDDVLREPPSDREPVCTAEPSSDIPALATRTLSCEAATVDGVEPGDEAYVVPYFEDRYHEYSATSDRFHVELSEETVSVVSSGDDSGAGVTVERLDAPAEATHTSSFTVTVTLANGGDADGTVDLQIDGDVACEPSEQGLTVEAGGEATTTVECAPAESDLGTASVEVTATEAGGTSSLDSGTTTVDVVEPDSSGELTVTDASYDGFTFDSEHDDGGEIVGLEPGEDLTVTATVENVGEQTATRDVMLSVSEDCVDQDDTYYGEVESVTLAPGEAATVEFECRLVYDVDFEGEPYLDLRPFVAIDGDQSTTTTRHDVADFGLDLHDEAPFRLIPPQSATNVSVAPPIEGPQTATVGSEVRVGVFLWNDGAPANQTFTVERDGRILWERDVRLSRDDGEFFPFTYAPDAVGTHDLTVRTADHTYEYPVDVVPAQTSVEVVAAPESVPKGGEAFDVEVRVDNEEDVDVEETVALTVAGAEVANRSVQIEAGGEASAVLSAPVPAGSGGEIELSVATATEETTTTVAVDGPDLDLAGLVARGAAVGEPLEVSANYVNGGGTGAVSVALDAYDPATGEHLGTLDEVSTDVAAEEHGAFDLEFTPPASMAGSVELVASTGDGEEYRRTLTVAPPSDAVSVTVTEAPDSVVHAAEVVDVEIAVENEWDRSFDQNLTVGAAGEKVEVPVSVAPGTNETVQSTVPVYLLQGEETVVEAALGPVRDVRTVPIAGPLNETFQGGYEPAPYGEDGLYRDVDGDGAVGQNDVAVFFRLQHRQEWKRPEYFDFSGNGVVTHGDVLALADYVALN